MVNMYSRLYSTCLNSFPSTAFHCTRRILRWCYSSYRQVSVNQVTTHSATKLAPDDTLYHLELNKNCHYDEHLDGFRVRDTSKWPAHVQTVSTMEHFRDVAIQTCGYEVHHVADPSMLSLMKGNNLSVAVNALHWYCWNLNLWKKYCLMYEEIWYLSNGYL